MKRVGRPASAPAVRPRKVTAVEAAAEDPEETQRTSRRRLNSFVPSAYEYEAELELVGSPLSRAEIVNMMIRAKGMFVSFYGVGSMLNEGIGLLLLQSTSQTASSTKSTPSYQNRNSWPSRTHSPS